MATSLQIADGRFRRVSPIASGRSDGPLSDRKAGGQPAQRELVFMSPLTAVHGRLPYTARLVQRDHPGPVTRR
jgi:hypothetical protein